MTNGQRQPMTKAQQRQVRLAAIVIIVTFPLWLLASWIGGQLGLPPRYAFLADFAALAAFAFALIILWRVWRERNEGDA